MISELGVKGFRNDVKLKIRHWCVHDVGERLKTTKVDSSVSAMTVDYDRIMTIVEIGDYEIIASKQR